MLGLGSLCLLLRQIVHPSASIVWNGPRKARQNACLMGIPFDHFIGTLNHMTDSVRILLLMIVLHCLTVVFKYVINNVLMFNLLYIVMYYTKL